MMEKRGKHLYVSPNIPPLNDDLADEILPYQNSRRGVFVGFKDIYDNLTPTTTSVITGGSYEAENKDYNYVKGMYILTRFGDAKQVHYVSGPLAMREQLTYCDEPVKECYPAPPAMRMALISTTTENSNSNSTTSNSFPSIKMKRSGSEVALNRPPKPTGHHKRSGSEIPNFNNNRSTPSKPSHSRNSSEASLKFEVDVNLDGHLFVFGTDNGGDENISYSFYHSGGKINNLKFHDEEKYEDGTVRKNKILHMSWTWSNNLGYAVFVSNARDGKHFDLYIVSVKDLAKYALDEEASKEGFLPCHMLYKNDKSGYLRMKDFDGNYVLVEHYTAITDSRLLLFELDKDDMTSVINKYEVGGGDIPASVGTCGQVMGGRGEEEEPIIVFSSARGEDNEYKSVRYWKPSSPDVVEDLFPADKVPKWDVESITYDHSFAHFVFGYNEDGSSTYFYADAGCVPHQDRITNLRESLRMLDSFAEHPGPSLGLGVAVGSTQLVNVSDNACLVGLSFVTPTSPADSYVYRLEMSAEDRINHEFKRLELMQYTKSEIGGLDARTFFSPSLFRYTSFDGLQIPAFLYKPDVDMWSDDFQGIPVIIHPHGGPEGQHRPKYQEFYQFLMARHGIAIIDPNVRGSRGYGKTYVSMDNCYNREKSVKDIGSLIDWIETTGRNEHGLDPNRIAVWGGSYGGYMVLASLIHFNDKIRCGIDMVGISNFVTFLENTAPYRRDLRRIKYGDESDPEMRKFLEEISPLNNVDKIKAPLFVVQGKNDPRVPVGEAEQIYKTVSEKGIEAWYMLAHDEGHGFKRRRNNDAYENAMVEFLRKFLLCPTTTSDNGGETIINGSKL